MICLESSDPMPRDKFESGRSSQEEQRNERPNEPAVAAAGQHNKGKGCLSHFCPPGLPSFRRLRPSATVELLRRRAGSHTSSWLLSALCCLSLPPSVPRGFPQTSPRPISTRRELVGFSEGPGKEARSTVRSKRIYICVRKHAGKHHQRFHAATRAVPR